MGEFVKAALLGCALGDAYGGAFARSELPMRGPVWNLGADAQQVFATCEAIVRDRGISPDGIAASLLDWYKHGRINNPGPASLVAYVEMSSGKPWREAGQKGPISFSNEAVTRLAPLAFLLDPSTDEGLERLRQVCGITHQSDQALDAALAVVLALRCIRNEQQNFLALLLRQLPESLLRDRMVAISNRPELSLRQAGRTFGASNNAIDSVPLALAAARLAPSLGFEGTLKELVSAGGEMRSNCAIAGMVAAVACGGINALPKDWLLKLRDVRHWERCLGIASDFAALVDELQGVKTLF